MTCGPDDEGVLVSCGAVGGGYSLYVKDSALHHDYDHYGRIYRSEFPARIQERGRNNQAESSGMVVSPLRRRSRFGGAYIGNAVVYVPEVVSDPNVVHRSSGVCSESEWLSVLLRSEDTIEYAKVVGSPRAFADAEFDRCKFEGGVLAQYDDPACNLVVRNVALQKCRVGRAGFHGVRFEQVTVDHLTHPSSIDFEGCLFDQVILRGPVGQIMTSPPHVSLHNRTEFEDAAKRFYADLGGWALDISEAAFSDAEFRQVPGHLVKRDPETQFLVDKQAAAIADVDTLPGMAQIAAERVLESPYDSIVAVAPTRSKDFQEIMEELVVLRDRGIAD